MQLIPSSGAIGAEIAGIDASRPCTDTQFEELAAAFYERSVVVLRDQHLDPRTLLAFARRFAEPDCHFLGHYALSEHPNILVLSNIVEDGRPLGFADAGRVWHSDGSYLQTPVAVTMLYALEVPVEAGRALGDTEFASAWSAYDALAPELQRRIEGLESVHQVAGRRRALGTGRRHDRDHEESQPDAVHPLVRVHPVTGRRYLFVNEGECIGIRGMHDVRALALIKELAAAVAGTGERYRHRWQVGNLLIWDNQAVQHLATFDYEWPRHRRLMHRITIPERAG